jgi:hypothetical protein
VRRQGVSRESDKRGGVFMLPGGALNGT